MSAAPPGTVIGRLRIKVLPDTSDFRRELQSELEAIEKSIGSLGIEVVANLNETSFLLAGARAASLVPDSIDVAVNARGGRGGGGGKSDVDDAKIDGRGRLAPFDGSVAERFERFETEAAEFFATLASPAARGATIAAGLGAVALVVSPIVGALALIPGLAATAAASLGPLILSADALSRAFGDTLNEEIRALPDAFDGIGAQIGIEWAVTINSASETITKGFEGIGLGIKDLSDEVSDVIREAEKSGQLERIFDNISDALGSMDENDILGTLTQFLLDAIEWSASRAPGFFEDLGKSLEKIGDAFAEMAADGTLDGAIEDLGGMLDLLPGLVTELGGLVETLGDLNEAVGDVKNGLGVLQDEWEEAGEYTWADLGDDIADAINGAALDVTESANSIGSSIAALWAELGKYTWADLGNDIASPFRYAGERIGAAAGAIGSSIAALWAELGKYTWADLGDDIVDAFRPVAQRVRAALAPLAGIIRAALDVDLYGIGASIISGFIAGLVSQFGAVQRALNRLTALIPTWKGPPATDRRLLQDAADDVMDGFIGRVESRFRDVRRTFGRTPIEIDGTAGAGAAGLTQQFYVDPSADEGYVQSVSQRAGREASRALALRYGRV